MSLRLRILKQDDMISGKPYLIVQVNGPGGAKSFPAVLEEVHTFAPDIIRQVPIVGLDDPEG